MCLSFIKYIQFKLKKSIDSYAENGASEDEDTGNIPESFYTNGGLKLRVVWTISSLIAASARHFLLQNIISEHPTLENLILTDTLGMLFLLLLGMLGMKLVL